MQKNPLKRKDKRLQSAIKTDLKNHIEEDKKVFEKHKGVLFPLHTRYYLSGFFEQPSIKIGNTRYQIVDIIGLWLYKYAHEKGTEKAINGFIDIFDHEFITANQYVVLSGATIKEEIYLSDTKSIVPFDSLQKDSSQITKKVIDYMQVEIKKNYSQRFLPMPVAVPRPYSLDGLEKSLSVLKIQRRFRLGDIFQLKNKFGIFDKKLKSAIFSYMPVGSLNLGQETSGVVSPNLRVFPCQFILENEAIKQEVDNTVNLICLYSQQPVIYADQWLDIETPYIWGDYLNYFIPSDKTPILSKNLNDKFEIKEDDFSQKKELFESMPEGAKNHLISSMRVFRKAHDEDILSNKIVALATAFDRLLAFGEFNNKKKISNRSACLIGSNLSEKKVIFENLGNLYEARSDFAHKNNTEVADLENLYREGRLYWIQIVNIFLEKKEIPDWKTLNISSYKTFEDAKKDGVFDKVLFNIK